MNRFSSWGEFEAWLNGLGMFHMDLGLERIKSGMKLLGAENSALISAQVLGTNGKGSTCAFLDALGQAYGLKTGLYTSPHFLSPAERILICGKQLSSNDWLTGANAIFRAYGKEPDLTYFEFLTLLALWLFQKENVEFAIFEAGLGGRNDATSAIDVDVHCYAPIALDHAAIIGPTIENIAHDKAAALKPGSVYISAPQYPAVKRILQDHAKTSHAGLLPHPILPEGAKTGLAGAHQLTNASVALGAWQYLASRLNIAASSQATNAALLDAFIPGRLQKISASADHPAFILDGAHNPHAMQQLVNNLADKPEAIIFSCLRDKDWQSTLGILCRAMPDTPLFVPQLNNDRAADAEMVVTWIEQISGRKTYWTKGRDALAKIMESVPLRANGPVLVTGSLFLLAEFFKLFPQYLNKRTR